MRKQPQASSRFADVSPRAAEPPDLDGAFDANVARCRRLGGVPLERLPPRDAIGTGSAKDGSRSAVNPALVWRPDERTRLAFNAEYVRAEFPARHRHPDPRACASLPVARRRSYQIAIRPVETGRLPAALRRRDAASRTRVDLRNTAATTPTSNGFPTARIVVGAFPNGAAAPWWPARCGLLDDQPEGLRQPDGNPDPGHHRTG